MIGNGAKPENLGRTSLKVWNGVPESSETEVLPEDLEKNSLKVWNGVLPGTEILEGLERSLPPDLERSSPNVWNGVIPEGLGRRAAHAPGTGDQGSSSGWHTAACQKTET